DARFWNNVDTVKLFYNGQRLPLTYANWTTSGIEKCTKYSIIDPDREFDSKNGVYKSYWAILSSSNAEIQIPIYRLADVLLLRAEALNKTGKPTDALNIVNQMRSRVGYTADAKLEVNTADQTAVEMLILQERQLEFIAEGKRWFDLIRTDHLLEVMDPVIRARQEVAGVQVTGFTQAEEGKKYMPIYYREFESNTALKGDQNPPYSEG
ncbi:MAG: RagB/SusD family nutrient uptake outer membrane protein, partial [Proteiniphilum sp.]|nr:RagB/SusD family nutrient uptake outer membrane protein [Proteiniphilum sp.]